MVRIQSTSQLVPPVHTRGPRLRAARHRGFAKNGPECPASRWSFQRQPYPCAFAGLVHGGAHSRNAPCGASFSERADSEASRGGSPHRGPHRPSHRAAEGICLETEGRRRSLTTKASLEKHSSSEP